MQSSHIITIPEMAKSLWRLIPKAPRALHAVYRGLAFRANSSCSIGSTFEEQARKKPHHPCVLFEGLSWTYQEFNEWVNQVAYVFIQRGITKGDTVAVLFDNRPELLVCVLALAKIGAIAGMLNPNQRGDALKYSIEVIKPKALIVGHDFVQTLQRSGVTKSAQEQWFYFGDAVTPAHMDDLVTLAKNSPHFNPPCTSDVKAGDPCFLIFTSGTTGMPKAARMTNLRWLRSGHGMGQGAMRINGNDIFYCPLPFYHNNALTMCLSTVLTSGATLAMARKFSASNFWPEVVATKATAFIYIGEICRYLLNQPESSLDQAHHIRVISGNGVRPEIWDAFQKRFNIPHICEFYAASEGNLAFINIFNLTRTAGFSPLSYAIVSFDPLSESVVRNAAGFIDPVGLGQVGLLLTEVTPKAPFDGYTDKQANAQKLLHNVFRQGDVWINSGDLVLNQGWRHIAFVDRLGDTFRWKGENVATTEVERALATLSGVEHVCAYGVQLPHSDGRAGMASLVLAPGAQVDTKQWSVQLHQLLPSYAVPLFIRIINSQQLTDTFKIRKVELKKQGYALDDNPVYVLTSKTVGYELLTESMIEAIAQKRLSF